MEEERAKRGGRGGDGRRWEEKGGEGCMRMIGDGSRGVGMRGKGCECEWGEEREGE